MAEDKEGAPQDGGPSGIEQECETWDWARAAGVSAEELRQALQEKRRIALQGLSHSQLSA